MPPTGRIFLNYRRDDSRYATLGIYDRLAAHFGEDAVFMDVDNIQAGLDFVEVLQQEVQACDVLVAVVGKSWLNIKDAAGHRRLDNPEDFVRVEIATALHRNIRVIPVLLDGILMPRSTDLPDELKPFARRNALHVEHDSFGSDVRRLIRQLEYALADAEESRAMKARAVAKEVARKEKQAKIVKLHTQADTAISLQDWALAQRKLKDILGIDENDLQAQAKLEIIDAKLTEEKAHQDALKKERWQEKVAAFTNFMKGKGALIGVGIVLFVGLIFGRNYLFSNFFDILKVGEKLGVGSTMISEKDGMTLVYVPAGEFQMGGEVYGDEKPIHTVTLDAYWIDQTEVTNAMYAKCVAAGACDKPSHNSSSSRDSYYGNAEFDNYPVIYVSWQDADNYCEWAGRRLPSEAEWEKAARGGLEGKLYPWGDKTPVCKYGAESGAKFDDNVGCNDTDTEAVASYAPNGYGAYDLAGNVWEWVDDWYDAYPGNTIANDYYGTIYKVRRGGSWSYNENSLRSAYRSWFSPFYASNDIGFRCSRSS